MPLYSRYYSQVIDYQACRPVSTYLAKHYANQRFSAIIDAYGVQEIYSNCGAYLSPGKPFVTVGIAHKDLSYSSMLYVLFRMVTNRLIARLPGEGRRSYLLVTATMNLEATEKMRSMIEQGKLSVPIDSCWDMKDALQVRLTNSTSNHEVRADMKI